VRPAARELLWVVSRIDQSYRRLADAAADRQHAESRRVDTEERFRTFFQSSPVPMALVRVRDGRMLDLNASFLTLAGRRRDEARGLTIYDMATDLDVSVKPEEWRPFLERLAHGASIQDFEVRFQGPDGAVRYLSVYGEGVPVEGDPCAVFQLLDVTDRRHAERLLRESERTYFEFYENAPDLYISVDTSTGAILRCNRKFCETLGLRKQEVIGLPLERILDPADADRSRRAMRALRTTGKLRNVLLRARRSNGASLEVSASASAVRGSDGRVRLSRVILRDLSRAHPEARVEQTGAHA
jgi:PAS domain S-box-containing protein